MLIFNALGHWNEWNSVWLNLALCDEYEELLTDIKIEAQKITKETGFQTFLDFHGC